MSEQTHATRRSGLLTEAVKLRYPSCDLKQYAALAGIAPGAAQWRYESGELAQLVMRTLRGEEWRPGGRVTLDALRVREHLGAAGRERFDAWQRAESLSGDAEPANTPAAA